jgi:large subunit ribosomal protein L22
VKIRGKQLKALADKAGISVEQLAQAIERTGLSGDKAVSAVKNWMRDSDHPHCRAEDIEKLARVLGCTIPELARFTCVLRWHRGTTRKTALVTDMIRGKQAIRAGEMLSFTNKRAAKYVQKTLNAAIAEASQYRADEAKLVVVETHVGNGPRMKRFQPKDRGRAHAIIKDFCHITVGVEER